MKTLKMICLVLLLTVSALAQEEKKSNWSLTVNTADLAGWNHPSVGTPKIVGALSFKNGRFEFEGDASESAKLFIQQLNLQYQATLQQEIFLRPVRQGSDRNSPALYAYGGVLDGQQRAAGVAQAPDGSAVQLSETVPAESRVTIYGKSLNGQVSHVWLKSGDREEVVPIIGVYVQPYFGWEMMSFRLPPGWTGDTEVRAESWEFRSNVVRLAVQ